MLSSQNFNSNVFAKVSAKKPAEKHKPIIYCNKEALVSKTSKLQQYKVDSQIPTRTGSNPFSHLNKSFVNLPFTTFNLEG
jgi:hypothetical protein